MKYIKLFLGALKKTAVPDLIFLFAVFVISEIVYQLRAIVKNISLIITLVNAIEYIFSLILEAIKLYVDFIAGEINLQPEALVYLLALGFTAIFGFVLYRYTKSKAQIGDK